MFIFDKKTNEKRKKQIKKITKKLIKNKNRCMHVYTYVPRNIVNRIIPVVVPTINFLKLRNKNIVCVCVREMVYVCVCNCSVCVCVYV